MKNIILTLTVSLFVSACGGGSGANSNLPETNVSEQQTSTTTPTAPTQNNNLFAAITGVYDASYRDNKAIVLITTDGQYKVFDDLNDTLGQNKACYDKPSATTPNSQFNGLRFEFDENTRHFNLKDANPSLAFEIDDNNQLTYIIYGGNITVGGGGLTINSADKKVVISRTKLNLTEADVLANKCQ